MHALFDEAHAVPEALLSDFDQAKRLFAAYSYWVSAASVSHIAVKKGDDIKRDNIPVLEHLRFGRNAMDQDVID